MHGSCDRNGFGLAIAGMLALVLLGLVALGYQARGLDFRRTTALTTDEIVARQLARAGLERARLYLVRRLKRPPLPGDRDQDEILETTPWLEGTLPTGSFQVDSIRRIGTPVHGDGGARDEIYRVVSQGRARRTGVQLRLEALLRTRRETTLY